MALLDNYLRQLRLFLPREQRDDIVRELSEEIRAQAAEQEAELGRPLDLAEEAALLKSYGHPLATAARYRTPRYLVGPLVFPYYLLVLKIVVGLVLAGHIVSAVALVASGAGWPEIGRLAEQFVRTALTITGWLTLLAAAVEASVVKSGVLEKWNGPMARVPRGTAAIRNAARTVDWPSPTSPLAIDAVLAVWWLLALRFPALMFGVGTGITWAPAMDRLYPVLATGALVLFGRHFLRIVPGDRWSRLARIALAFNAVVFLYFVATSDHQWIVWTGGSASLVNTINYTFSAAFVGAIVLHALRMVRGRRLT